MIEKPARTHRFFDPAHTASEMGEAGLIQFIEKRHNQRVKEEGRDRPAEEAWEESCRLYAAQKEAELREEWRTFHEAQIERHKANHAALVAYHKRELEKCLQENPKGAA